MYVDHGFCDLHSAPEKVDSLPPQPGQLPIPQTDISG